jgi:hypothetical protein
VLIIVVLAIGTYLIATKPHPASSTTTSVAASVTSSIATTVTTSVVVSSSIPQGVNGSTPLNSFYITKAQAEQLFNNTNLTYGVVDGFAAGGLDFGPVLQKDGINYSGGETVGVQKAITVPGSGYGYNSTIDMLEYVVITGQAQKLYQIFAATIRGTDANATAQGVKHVIFANGTASGVQYIFFSGTAREQGNYELVAWKGNTAVIVDDADDSGINAFPLNETALVNIVVSDLNSS